MLGQKNDPALFQAYFSSGFCCVEWNHRLGISSLEKAGSKMFGLRTLWPQCRENSSSAWNWRVGKNDQNVPVLLDVTMRIVQITRSRRVSFESVQNAQVQGSNHPCIRCICPLSPMMKPSKPPWIKETGGFVDHMPITWVSPIDWWTPTTYFLSTKKTHNQRLKPTSNIQYYWLVHKDPCIGFIIIPNSLLFFSCIIYLYYIYIYIYITKIPPV